MNVEGIIFFPLWIGTALFVMLVVMVAKLIVDQFLKGWLTRLLPVIAGLALSMPTAMISRSFSWNGISMFWFVLASGAVFSLLGIRISKKISK